MCSPIPYSRIVLAPTNDPTLGEIPCACIARSHASKPCAPWKGLIILSVVVSDALSASVSALTGATVYASPRISVVTPCVSFPTSRPSPRREQITRLSLDVDESRRHHHPRRVDALRRLRIAELPASHDARDAVAFQRDIAIEPGIAAPVDDAPVDDDHVVALTVRWSRCRAARLWRRARTRERECERRNGGSRIAKAKTHDQSSGTMGRVGAARRERARHM